VERKSLINSCGITVWCQEVEDEIEKKRIVRSEEGEMMVYVAMMCITQMGFSHRNSDEGVNSIAEIHSDDSDAFAGISMQAIFSIESFYKKDPSCHQSEVDGQNQPGAI
jgi:hypothetical protein